MDSLIKRFDFDKDADLNLCLHRGIAYQRDMKISAKYDEDYWNKCAKYETENPERFRAVNQGRLDFVNKYCKGADLLDIGIGAGHFLKARNDQNQPTRGLDVNPYAKKWLQENDLWSDNFPGFKGFCLWDVIEHLEQPERMFRHMGYGSYLFTSIPVFEDLKKIRESRHYRPGEHLYYYTDKGFVEYMALWGWRLVEKRDFEQRAGREQIMSYAFCRDLPDYHKTVAQYDTIHSSKHYGSSAMLYFEPIAKIVLRLNPERILDFGCGRSDLVCHFWNDGKREIHRYDPVIPQYKTMPGGNFGLVICCDVMEHICMRDVDRIFKEIHVKARNVIFSISTKPARTVLPDGRNAHVTLLRPTEWKRWIEDTFGKCIEEKSGFEHILLVKTF